MEELDRVIAGVCLEDGLVLQLDALRTDFNLLSGVVGRVSGDLSKNRGLEIENACLALSRLHQWARLGASQARDARYVAVEYAPELGKGLFEDQGGTDGRG